MKSWITLLLPNDEYKEKKMLYFLSEGAVILLLSLFGLMLWSQSSTLELEMGLLLSIAVFLLYVTARYITSGIEYTDIATEHAYKREIRNIWSRTGVFVVLFTMFYVIIQDFPTSKGAWIDLTGLLISISLFSFFFSYISLKRSYNKNKDLV